MPLTPSDAAYLNHLLDRHLKEQRSWPRLRYFHLGLSAFWIVMAICVGYFPQSIAHIMMSFDTPATLSATAASRPVTQADLLAPRSSMEMHGAMTTLSATLTLYCSILAVFLIILSIHHVAWVLSKWNHHRRDTILISLLREKCAPELAPPTAPQTATP